MAGAKLSPRQKMINLMYLVFIAMMALNLSREVLSAFGMMNEKIEMTNLNIEENVNVLLGDLEMRASDDPTRYADPNNRAKRINKISKSFYSYIEELKNNITDPLKKKDEKLSYEVMDKSTETDSYWFKGDKYSDKGREFIDVIEQYKKDINEVVNDNPKYASIVEDLFKRFDLSDVVDEQGVKKPYLNYHFYGFPSIATLTKLTSMQNDVKTIEAKFLNAFMGNTLLQAASMKNYEAIVIPEKSAFFAGESFKGKVVLGRYDKSTVPVKVVVNGKEVNLANSLDDGQVNLSFTTGNVGEHKINGTFSFMEDGEPVDIPINGNYVVVPMPNSATVSADKMNVVYRGVSNPMTISIAGVSSDRVNASAPGLRKVSGEKYVMNPGAGREVVINVSGTLPDGKSVADRKTFRIKGIPAPRGTIRGEYSAKGQKSNLEIVTVGAKLEDFDFDINLTVTGFVLQVPGQPSVVVQGNRMNERAKAAIRKARLGDVVVISDIKVRLEGAGSYMLPKTAPCTFEIR